jgi:primosomal protein N' (replication factor Y)
MDSDSMSRPGSHDEALDRFRRGEVQILLGTQMIAKGLDFPNVTLVGVVDADTMLRQPDMRASERTFQLIAQVAGRTGRSERGGRVLVQTTCPQDPAIRFASRHDYIGFAGHELAARLELQAPPYSSAARVILRGLDEQSTRLTAQAVADRIREARGDELQAVRVLGAAPAPVLRLRNHWRFHLQLAAQDPELIRQLWRKVQYDLSLPEDVEFTVDMDPINAR